MTTLGAVASRRRSTAVSAARGLKVDGLLGAVLALRVYSHQEVWHSHFTKTWHGRRVNDADERVGGGEPAPE